MQKGISTKVAMTIIVVIVIVLGGLFLLIGKKNIEENSLVTMKNNVVQDVLKVSTDTQKDTITYENKEYGFSLELPAMFAGYEFKENIVTDPKGVSAFGLFVLVNNKETWIYSILITPLNKWTATDKDSILLGKNNHFVFEGGVPYWASVEDWNPCNSSSENFVNDERFCKEFELFNSNASAIIQKGFKVLDTAQSVVNTSDWKTYTNTAYGISFQYPMNANVDVEKFPNEEENTITIRNLGESELRLTVFPNSNSKSIQFSNVNDTWKDLVSGKSKICSKVMIAGEYGYRCFSSEVSGSVSATVDYYFKKKDSLYMASMVVLGNQDEKKADEIIAMLR